MNKAQLINTHNNLMQQAAIVASSATKLLTQQAMLKQTKEKFLDSAKEHEQSIVTLSAALKDNKEALGLLNTVKDMNTAQSYAFIEHNLNIALEKVFNGSVRRIRLVEGTYNSKYPELRLELITENNVKRSLKTDSGHGMRQVVSLLCTLCLICVSEVLTGLSPASRQAVDDILWAFADIGFQFLIVEHGFIAKGSQVYELKLENGVSKATHEYIADKGFYMGVIPKNSATGYFAIPENVEQNDSNADNNDTENFYNNNSIDTNNNTVQETSLYI